MALGTFTGLYIHHQWSTLKRFHHLEKTPRTPELSPPRPHPSQAREPLIRSLWTSLFWTHRIHRSRCRMLFHGGSPSGSTTFPGSIPPEASVKRPPFSFLSDTLLCRQTTWCRPFIYVGHSVDPPFGDCACAVVNVGVSMFPHLLGVSRGVEVLGHVAALCFTFRAQTALKGVCFEDP